MCLQRGEQGLEIRQTLMELFIVLIEIQYFSTRNCGVTDTLEFCAISKLQISARYHQKHWKHHLFSSFLAELVSQPFNAVIHCEVQRGLNAVKQSSAAIIKLASHPDLTHTACVSRC